MKRLGGRSEFILATGLSLVEDRNLGRPVVGRRDGLGRLEGRLGHGRLGRGHLDHLGRRRLPISRCRL
jgi:hypothetical protein